MPRIERDLFKAAYEMEKEGRLYHRLEATDTYIVPSKSSKIIETAELEAAYRSSFLEPKETFDDYRQERFKVTIAVNQRCSLASFRCTCSNEHQSRTGSRTTSAAADKVLRSGCASTRSSSPARLRRCSLIRP